MKRMMKLAADRRHAGLRAALLALALGLCALIWMAPPGLVALRERVFDRVLATVPPTVPPARPGLLVRVVDFGEEDAAGLPWSRAATARLIDRLADAAPAVIALDVVFSADCDPGPVTEALALGLARAPSVLGFLLVETGTLPPQPPPGLVVAEGAAATVPGLWQAPGAEAACPAFARQAAASAGVAMAADADGLVRRVPAVVMVNGTVYPSLAVAAVAVGTGLPPVLQAPASLALAGHDQPLDASGTFRLTPTPPSHWAGRTLDAAGVLAGDVDLDALRGAVVLVGSSLPRRGGLRATAQSAVQPSVQIHADIAERLLAGPLVQRPQAAPMAEAGLVALAGVAVAVLVPHLPALPLLGAALLLAGVWAGICLAAARIGLLLDPVYPAAAVIGLALLGVTGQAVASARAERRLRGRMAQLLPPAVVARIAAAPGLMRLSGESREVTAMFTDIEGFTLTTRQLGPEALVRLLDQYFALTTAIVLRHGGMIDKIVGDSLHCLFNAPLDLPHHVDAALTCAAEILTATEVLRARTGLGLGRTRIGIETGEAVLGDVGGDLGGAGRIDYTAHGDAINLAARLQDANKDLGTSVCVGPGAAAQATKPLQPLGEVEIRSFGKVALYTLAVPAGSRVAPAASEAD